MAIVEPVKDKYCGSKISQAELIVAYLQIQHFLSATMSMQIQLAEQRLLLYACFNSAARASSFLGECARRCLLKAVRKWFDGCA